MTTNRTGPAGASPMVTVLLVFALFLPLLGVDLPLPAHPRIGQDLGVDVAQVQIGLALFAGCFGVMHLIYGPLADRFGRKPFLLGGLALMSVSAAACALAQSIETLWIGRGLMGLGAAGGPLLARAIIRDLHGAAGSGRMMGYVMAAFGTAAATLPIIGGQLTEHLGWRAAFWGAAGYGVVLIALAAAMLPETRPESAPKRLDVRALVGNYFRLFRDIRFILVTVSGGLVASAFFMWIAGSTFVIQTVLGYSPTEYALIYAFSVVAFIVFSILSGRLAAKHGSYRLMTVGVLISGFGGALCIVAGLTIDLTVYLLLIPVMIVIMGHGLTFPQSMAASIAPFPHLAATASALYGFLQYGFNGILTGTAGGFFDGTPTPMLVLIGILTLMAMLIYLTFRSRLTPAPTETP
jgi:DHA1 family bicyclomycin/chloramphenicol resistance-like MFS transporter